MIIRKIKEGIEVYTGKHLALWGEKTYISHKWNRDPSQTEVNQNVVPMKTDSLPTLMLHLQTAATEIYRKPIQAWAERRLISQQHNAAKFTKGNFVVEIQPILWIWTIANAFLIFLISFSILGKISVNCVLCFRYSLFYLSPKNYVDFSALSLRLTKQGMYSNDRMGQIANEATTNKWVARCPWYWYSEEAEELRKLNILSIRMAKVIVWSKWLAIVIWIRWRTFWVTISNLQKVKWKIFTKSTSTYRIKSNTGWEIWKIRW